MLRNITIVACMAPLLVSGAIAAPGGGELANQGAINKDPFVDELMTNGVESQSPFWSEVKEQLTNGNVDQAVKLCRKVLARRELDIDMHCMYAMALEMKYRSLTSDSDLFNECVREWTHVAKAKILSAHWDSIGEGEVFKQNQERKKMADRHLIALVGRAPKMFENEQVFVQRAMQIHTEVAGKVTIPTKQM
jgi:hypothetical protein